MNLISYKNGQAVLLVIALVLLFLAACKNTPAETQEKAHAHHEEEEMEVELTAAQYKMAKIKLGSFEKKQLSNVLAVNGMLDVPPQNLVSVSIPFGGFVANTELLQGMQVKKGDVLAVMEHTRYVELQQNYIDKKIKLEYLEQEYKRQEELQKENVNAAKVFQQVKADYKSIKLQIRALSEKLSIIGINAKTLTENTLSRKINIYSPISGYVSEVNVNLGKYVNPTDVLFEIVNTEHLHAELSVYEKDVTKLKVGQKVRFTLAGESEKTRWATIHLIGRRVEEDRTIRVHAHLEEEDKELLPKMYLNAKIELNENQVNSLPENAVLMVDGKHYIFIVKNSKPKDTKHHHFIMLEVQKGVTENGFTEINIDKKETKEMKVVIKGAYSLLAMLKNTGDEGGGHGH